MDLTVRQEQWGVGVRCCIVAETVVPEIHMVEPVIRKEESEIHKEEFEGVVTQGEMGQACTYGGGIP